MSSTVLLWGAAVLVLGAAAVMAQGNQDPNCFASLTTDTTYRYRYHLLPPVPSENAQDLSVPFTVTASNDVHISLAPDSASTALYEIVIGGWGNTQSVIRRCKQCENLVSTRHSPLSATERRIFLVTYRAGRVAVFAGIDETKSPFMEYVDPHPLNIGVVGFSTGWGSDGLFLFNTCAITG